MLAEILSWLVLEHRFVIAERFEITEVLRAGTPGRTPSQYGCHSAGGLLEVLVEPFDPAPHDVAAVFRLGHPVALAGINDQLRLDDDHPVQVPERVEACALKHASHILGLQQFFDLAAELFLEERPGADVLDVDDEDEVDVGRELLVSLCGPGGQGRQQEADGKEPGGRAAEGRHGAAPLERGSPEWGTCRASSGRQWRA
jgi:hypothetical protein